MKELTELIPFAVSAVSIGAALIVVSVATQRVLKSFYPRTTAVVLALGVTIMALVGAAPVILVSSPAGESSQTWLANGSALMLLPFLTLAISRLLCDLLITVAGRTFERGPGPVALEATTNDTTLAPPAREARNTDTSSKPRGRPKKHQPPKRQGDTAVELNEDNQKVTPAMATAREGRQGANTL